MSQYDYFFGEHPEVKVELKKLGIELIDAVIDEQTWPALRLPSGTILAISQDDEGNGPGAIHVFTKEQLTNE